jgi:molybdenum cofactor cytidylyltransferase
MAEIKGQAKKIGAIILAAGASSRLGTPKQLLMYRGKTLLQQILQVTIDSIAHPVVVVLGADADNIKKNMDFSNACIVVNTDWQEGMASSVRCGINTLVQMDPLIEGAVLMLCDQPFVTASLLNDLIIARQNTGKHIVASSYNGTFGVPALFHKSIFPELLQLKGDVGARSIIQQRAKEVEAVLFSKGDIDIDTAADYQELSKGNDKV